MDAEVKNFVDQYKMAVAIAGQLVEELGEEAAHAILQRALNKMQAQILRDRAKSLGSNSFGTLVDYNRKLAAERDDLEVLEVTDDRLALKLTRCRACEAFEHLGAPEICRLYCDTDFSSIKAFSPNIKLVRTKTIASGDGYCDHTYLLQR